MPNAPLDLANLYKIGEELEVALAHEHEPWIRTRLLTLRARAGGLAALLIHDNGVRQHNSLLPELRSDPRFRTAINGALASQPPPYIRNRLLCIQAVLDGAHVSAVARAARGPRTSLLRSLYLFYRGGLPMLLAHTHASPFDHVTNIRTNTALPRRQFWKFTAAQAKAARAQISVALLETSLHRRHRNRLLAIDAALAGEPVGIIAARSQLKIETIRVWVRKMLRSGIDSVIPQSQSRIRPGSVPATEQEIEAALANATSRKVRKRLIALLAILQGQTVPAAAHTPSASEAAVTRWIKRLRSDGLAALLTSYPAGVRRQRRVPTRSTPV